MQLIEVIPFKSDKERFKLVQKYNLMQNCLFEVFQNYLFVEIFDWDIRKKLRKRRRGRGKKKVRSNSRAS